MLGLLLYRVGFENSIFGGVLVSDVGAADHGQQAARVSWYLVAEEPYCHKATLFGS